jgi:hypothetical protein
MSDSPRDTQFRRFAKLLLNELGDAGFIFEGADDSDRDQQLVLIKKIITRRAYDLVNHSVHELKILGAFEAGEYMDDYGHFSEDMIAPIPDMTEWPKEVEG